MGQNAEYRTLKILFVFHDREHYTGGPAINARRLLPSIQAQGQQVYALCIYGGDPNKAESSVHPNGDHLTSSGIPVFFRQYPNSSEKLVHWILQKVVDISPDVLIANISTPACFTARWLKKAGIPVINTHRSQDALNIGRAKYFTFGPELWRSSGLVSVNRFLLDNLGSAKKPITIPTEVIVSGVPIPKYIASQKDQPLKLVYAGRLENTQKCVDGLLKEIVKILKSKPNWTFTLLGTGSQKNVYQQYVQEESLEERIIFKGKLNGTDYKKALAQHQVFILFSDYEGTPGAVMDAMSCGLVPVVNRIPGIEELVEDGEDGIVFDKANQDLNKILEFLEKHPAERIRLANNSRQKIIAKFSLEVSTRKWIAFCQKLVDIAGPRKALEVPNRLDLPPNHPDLLEHIKEITKLQWVLSKIRRAPTSIYNRFR